MLSLVAWRKKTPVVRMLINYLDLSHTPTRASCDMLLSHLDPVQGRFLLTTVVHLGGI